MKSPSKKPGRLRVLIIDDAEEFASRLRELIEEDGGLEILDTAYDGDQAIEFFDRERPEILLIDVVMSRVGGLEVLRHVKRHSPGSICIMMTGHLEASYGPECLRAGADAFVCKTDGIDRIVALIRKLTEEL